MSSPASEGFQPPPQPAPSPQPAPPTAGAAPGVAEAPEPDDGPGSGTRVGAAGLFRRTLSLLYWLGFAIALPAGVLLSAVVALLALPFDRRGNAVHLYNCAYSYAALMVVPFWHMRVEGRRKLPWRGAAVLVSNHLSNLDPLALGALFRPFKWVSKIEVFRVPVLGWNLRLARHIELKRGDKGSIRRMYACCRQWLQRGVPVFLFPEGTRSGTGALRPFKDGAFRLACETGAPVFPIALWGTRAALPKDRYILGPARIRIRVLDPLDPAAFDRDPSRLREACRDQIAAALADLRAEDLPKPPPPRDRT